MKSVHPAMILEHSASIMFAWIPRKAANAETDAVFVNQEEDAGMSLVGKTPSRRASSCAPRWLLTMRHVPRKKFVLNMISVPGRKVMMR